MYPNPAVGRLDSEAGLFPYLAMLSVLTHFPDGIPRECYSLMISRMRTDAEVGRTVEHIRRYMSLTDREQRAIADRLRQMPLLKDGRIVEGGRRSSLFNTICLNSSYMLSFFKTPGLVEERDRFLLLNKQRYGEAEALVQEHIRSDCFIEFVSAEDWIAFYGQLDRQPSYEEAIQYYRTRGDVDRSTAAFSAARRKDQLPVQLQDLDERQFRRLNVHEKTLEDFLEFNLDLLEPGLEFVARQYPTSTGPLDILARDRAGRWVIVELKRDRAAERTIGQLLRYRGFIIAERAKGRDDQVRGFIVAPRADARLIDAARGAGKAVVEVYEFTIKASAQRIHPARKSNNARWRKH